MSPRYVVLAGFVCAETAVGAGRAFLDIPRGGHLPEDVPAEQVATLLRLGSIAPVETAVEESAEFTPGATIDKILAWVGDDPDRARTALADETRDGGKHRPTLISRLQTIAGG